MHDALFSWFKYIPGAASHLAVYEHSFAAAFAGLLLILFAGIARAKLAGAGNYSVPTPNLNFLNIFDMLSGALYGLTKKMLGDDAPKYFPLVGTLFLFIWINNLLGLFPGYNPATQNMNTTLACGLFVFVYYNWVGIKASGFAYLKHFLGPVWYIAPILLPIEIISHVVRPFSLAMRLQGNMTGDHMILATFTELVPYGVPVIFYFLGIMVCTIQAFVFSLLTMVYIMLAKEAEHH